LPNSAGNTALITPCFSLMAPNGYKLRVSGTAPISDTKNMEIETP